MKKILLAIVISLGSWTIAQAQEPIIEQGAKIYQSVARDAAVALAQYIQLYGYRCDSLSAVTPFTWSVGYSVVCNNWRYAYEVEDKGGNWIVTVD
ncbi:MAG: hypothetical protein OXQ84_06065 [bacterium]|nr:hypothetical protein [bacterium]